jgi:hypothetical protein
MFPVIFHLAGLVQEIGLAATPRGNSRVVRRV